jgi:hypothetical protein
MAARFGTHLWFRGFLKARIGLTTVAEIYLEQQKTGKNFLTLEDRRRKGWTIPKERIIATLELELLAPFEQAVAWHGVRGVLSGRWLAPLACHEQTTHIGARPEKKTVTPEVA